MENNIVDFKKDKAPIIVPDIAPIISFIEANLDKFREITNRIHIERREIPCNWFNYVVDIRYNAKSCSFILMVSFQSARENKIDTRFFVENSMEIHGVTGDNTETIIELLNDKYLKDANEQPENNGGEKINE